MALSLICLIYSRRFRALISGLDYRIRVSGLNTGYGLRALIRDTVFRDAGYGVIRDMGYFGTLVYDISMRLALLMAHIFQYLVLQIRNYRMHIIMDGALPILLLISFVFPHKEGLSSAL